MVLKVGQVAIALAVVAAVAVAWLVALTVVIPVLNGQDVKTLNLISPNSGDIELTSGAGIAVVPDATSHSIEIENTGVITINALAADNAGNLVLAVTSPGLAIASALHTITLSNGGVTQAGAGFGIAVSAITGNITISNTGVLGLVAGSGISVNASVGVVSIGNSGVLTINGAAPVGGNMVVTGGAGNTVTTVGETISVANTISSQTALARPNAQSPSVTYAVSIGSITAVPVATWRIGPDVGAPPNPWFPGSVDTGYGDASGVAWAVPFGSVGLFSVTLNCEITPNTIATNDAQLATVALSLGSNTEDPFASGVIPAGGYQTLPLAGGTNSGTPLPLPTQLSLSTIFQAGCSGCTVLAGDALTVHARLDHSGTGPGPYTMTVLCSMTVAHLY
jgi:hypothetical protein